MKLAVMFGVGESSFGESVGTTIRSSQTVKSLSGSINIGYRNNQYTLAYINAFYNIDEISGDLFYSGSNVYNRNTTSRTFGILAGIHISAFFGTFIIIEGGAAHADWPVYGGHIYYPAGLSMGFEW